MELGVTLVNMPQSRMQERVKRLRALNRDLRAVLGDQTITTYHQQASGDAISCPIVDITQTGVTRASQFFHSIRDAYTCQCAAPHAIGIGCSCRTCISPFSERLDLHSADEWEFCLAFFNLPSPDASDSATVLLQSIPGSHTDDNYPTTQDMCSLLKDVSAQRDSDFDQVVLDTANIKDKTLHPMKVSIIDRDDGVSPVSLKPFNELRRDSGLSAKYKLELAVRLSLAIMQLWNTPWVDESWTCNDVCVAKMEVPAPEGGRRGSRVGNFHGGNVSDAVESTVLFIVHRGIFSSTYDIETASATPDVAAVSSSLEIKDEEPVLTNLAFALIELALDRSIQEMKEEYKGLENIDDDTANIYIATKLLGGGKIRDAAGREYEAVVDVCLRKRFVDSRGVPISLSSKKPSFVSDFRGTVVMPLWLIWRTH